MGQIVTKERKPVSMRKYQRQRARAVMEREGIRRMNSRNQRDGIKTRYQSYFGLYWKKAARVIPKKKTAQKNKTAGRR